jgi:hypothetical protein
MMPRGASLQRNPNALNRVPWLTLRGLVRAYAPFLPKRRPEAGLTTPPRAPTRGAEWLSGPGHASDVAGPLDGPHLSGSAINAECQSMSRRFVNQIRVEKLEGPEEY